jgi:hypothetical protein
VVIGKAIWAVAVTGKGSQDIESQGCKEHEEGREARED